MHTTESERTFGAHEVTASFETLMRQAHMTVTDYIKEAPAEMSLDQKLKFAELCVEEYKIAVNAKLFN